MSNSTNLILPYLAAGQAQKHVTVNESLRKLDAVVQLAVVSATTSAEPASPSDGVVYILPGGKTGTSWASMADNALAYYRDGAWEQITPREGFIAFAKDTDQLLFFNGSAWVGLSSDLQVSATDRVLGRVTAGAGAVEEITCTAAGRALLDDDSASTQRTTLGLGTAATQNTGGAGATLPFCSGTNSWSGVNTFVNTGGAVFLQSTNPALRYEDTDSSTNNKKTQLRHGGDSFICSFINDANANEKFWLRAFSNASQDCNELELTASLFDINGPIDVAGAVTPAADNTYAIGSGSFRFSTIYAATGTINTSDAREKTTLEAIPAGVKRAVRSIMSGAGAFQWLASVADKGADAARLHVGVTAQAVRDAFIAEGEDPQRWALFCADDVFETVVIAPARSEINDDGVVIDTPEQTETRAVLDEDGAPVKRLGLRHDQLMMLALAVLFEGEA